MPNFQKIPQLIGFGNYSITIDFTMLLARIEDFYSECNLDLNPEFQRGYVWTQEQKERYVEFLLQGGNSGKDILFNYPVWLGSNAFDKDDPILNRMVIVDGKQRLSAVMGFMQNEVKAFGSYFSEFDGHLRCINHLNFHINELTTRKEVLQWYLQLNSGGTVHAEDELEKVRQLIAEVS
jgi:hypothetical protein